MPHVQVPHLRFPLQLVSHATTVQLAVVEQDTDEELWSNIEVILNFNKGMRPEKPEFGISDPTFDHPTVDEDLLHNELREQEPRINLVTEAAINTVNELVQSITIQEEDQGA